jgi:hypothetical protein
MDKSFDIQSMKIGDKCYYMYNDKPWEGIIKNILFYGMENNNIKKLSHYKVTVWYVYEKDKNIFGIDTMEPRDIFPTKEALMIHLNNLIEKNINDYKRYEDGQDTQ